MKLPVAFTVTNTPDVSFAASKAIRAAYVVFSQLDENDGRHQGATGTVYSRVTATLGRPGEDQVTDAPVVAGRGHVLVGHHEFHGAHPRTLDSELVADLPFHRVR